MFTSHCHPRSTLTICALHIQRLGWSISCPACSSSPHPNGIPESHPRLGLDLPGACYRMQQLREDRWIQTGLASMSCDGSMARGVERLRLTLGDGDLLVNFHRGHGFRDIVHGSHDGASGVKVMRLIAGEVWRRRLVRDAACCMRARTDSVAAAEPEEPLSRLGRAHHDGRWNRVLEDCPSMRRRKVSDRRQG